MSRKSRLTDNLSIEGFHKLWQGIQDVAINDLKFLPEDTNQVCGPDQVGNSLVTTITDVVHSWTAMKFEIGYSAPVRFLSTRRCLPRALLQSFCGRAPFKTFYRQSLYRL